MNSIQNISAVAINADSFSESSGLLSLEERLRDAASQAFVDNSKEKSRLLNIIDNPMYSSNPTVMLEVQKSIGEYDVKVRFASSLTHKAADAVSTLLKS